MIQDVIYSEKQILAYAMPGNAIVAMVASGEAAPLYAGTVVTTDDQGRVIKWSNESRDVNFVALTHADNVQDLAVYEQQDGRQLAQEEYSLEGSDVVLYAPDLSSVYVTYTYGENTPASETLEVQHRQENASRAPVGVLFNDSLEAYDNPQGVLIRGAVKVSSIVDYNDAMREVLPAIEFVKGV